VFFTGEPVFTVVKDSIETPEDLKGKKIGIINGSLFDYAFSRYLAKHDLTDDVEYVNVAAADQLATLARGDIDGFVNLDPVVSQALDQLDNVHKLEPDTNSVYTTRSYLLFKRE